MKTHEDIRPRVSGEHYEGEERLLEKSFGFLYHACVIYNIVPCFGYIPFRVPSL